MANLICLSNIIGYRVARLPKHGPNTVEILEPGNTIVLIFELLYIVKALLDTCVCFYLSLAYYWRIERDYDEVPEPAVYAYNAAEPNLITLRDQLLTTYKGAPRVVLHPHSASGFIGSLVDISGSHNAVDAVSAWAEDSVGLYTDPYATVLKGYHQLPTLDTARKVEGASILENNVNLCSGMFGPPPGNRSCFQICK